MAEPLTDEDVSALALPVKRYEVAGKAYRFPGDMPLELFLWVQHLEARAENEDEMALLQELCEKLLDLFHVYQPKLTKLPPMGVRETFEFLGRIYGGGVAAPDPTQNRVTRRSKKRTPSSTGPRSRATSA